MNNDFLRKGIVFPLVTALAAGIVAFCIVSANVADLSPFYEGAQVLNFDYLKTEKRETANPENPKAGTLMGELKGKETLDLVYECDYSGLYSAASLSEKGSLIGDTGTAYIEIINSNASALGDSLKISGVSGEHSYKKTGEKTVKNETEVFLTTPRNEKNAAVYYRQKGKGGLASGYTVVIYEEVA